MKYILLIIAALFIIRTESQGTAIFEADYDKLETQFEKWNAQTVFPKVITEEGQKVLHFDGAATKYGGVATKALTSTSGKFYVTLEFKGEKDVRTSGYLGYERSDALNIQRTLGLDAKINMELSQIFRFNATGEWATYLAYVEVPVGVTVKFILEKGTYFGNDAKSAKFRNFKVFDFDLCGTECPATDAATKIFQLGYYSFAFFNNELQYQIFGDVALADGDKSKATFTMQYPHNPLCCVQPTLYMLDTKGKVIEKFKPTYLPKGVFDLDASLISDKWTYSFTMNDIETLGCAESATFTQDNKDATKYTCPLEMHFYYDYAETFATKQAEFDYSSKNSQAIFKSEFYVVVYKETSTIFNSYIKTLEVNALCTGICNLDMSLKLNMLYSFEKDGEYKAAEVTEDLTKAVSIVWGTYVYFKIQSTPKDYNLDLMKVVITTENAITPFGNMFISSFIQEKKATQGELSFKMMISGEAGLSKGKLFGLQFLTESKAAGRRLLADELPSAGVSGQGSFTTTDSKKEGENSGNNAAKLAYGLLAFLLFLMLA